jgi:hypothetical protein
MKKNPQWIASNSWTVFNSPKCTQMSHLGVLPNSLKILARSEADLSVGSGIFQVLPSHRTTLFLRWCTLTARAASERVCTHKPNPSHAPTYSRTQSNPCHPHTHTDTDRKILNSAPKSQVSLFGSAQCGRVVKVYIETRSLRHTQLCADYRHIKTWSTRECNGREVQKLVGSSLRFKDLV